MRLNKKGRNKGQKLEDDILNKVQSGDSGSCLKLMKQHGIDVSQPFSKALHDKSLINGRPSEVKTDIIVGQWNFSVKKHKDVQLVSCGGQTASGYFELGAKKVFGSKNMIPSNLRVLMDDMSKLPKKMKPHAATHWKVFERSLFNSRVSNILNSYPALKEEIVKVALTGDGIFTNNASVANAVLTPKKLRRIDESYVKSASSLSKFDFRMKSRNGISEVNFRIGLDMRKIP